jgi:hypothetical protein
MKHLGMLEVIRHPDHYKAVIAVVGVMIAQQLTGMLHYEIIHQTPITS